MQDPGTVVSRYNLKSQHDRLFTKLVDLCATHANGLHHDHPELIFMFLMKVEGPCEHCYQEAQLEQEESP